MMDDDNHPLHSAASRPYSVASQRDMEYADTGSAYDEADAADPEELLGSEYSGSQYAEEEVRVDFEPSMVAQGLSGLAVTAAGTSVAYTQLDLTHTTLADSHAVAHCKQLQRVNLSHNRLTSLTGLGQLPHVMHLDASCNRLTQVLDLQLAPSVAVSPLLTANLSHNRIQFIQDLDRFSRLTSLVLDGNQIEAVAGLRALQQLRVLSLRGNGLRNCRGLEGLGSLQQLHLDGNSLTTLAPLSSCTQLQLLTATSNRLACTAGTGGLTCLRRLDIEGNAIRRLEAVADLRGATLLTSLNISDNPLVKAQHCRLHLVHLLPQLLEVNGQPVAAGETVEAADMHGAEAGGLAAIRKRYFPNGELEDGGGAIPPTAAGLVASRAEEEVTLGSATASAVMNSLDAAVATIPDSLAFEGMRPLADALLQCCSGSSGVSGSNSARLSKDGAAAAAAAAAAGGGAGAVAVHNQGPSGSHVYQQWKLARACYSWVVSHVVPPADGVEGDAGTWEVEPPLFQQPGLEEALLGGACGTWAERVALLYVTLAKAVHLEAVQLSGFWRDSAAMAVAPGDTLVTHNHSWAAVKVNGRWRLLDPVYASLRRGDAPWFTPPGVFLFTHLPFQSYWQLVGEPLSQEAWWARPEVTPAFFAAGCQLLDPTLAAVTTLPAPRPSQPLPTMHVAVAAPDWAHNQLQLQLRGEDGALLARWDTLTGRSSGSSPGSWDTKAWVQAHPHLKQQQQEQQQQAQQQQAAGADAPGSSHCSSSGGAGAAGLPQTLLFQQTVLGPQGVINVPYGPDVHTARLQDLWAALPGPGQYTLQVVLAKDTPGWLSLNIEGLDAPLQLTRHEEEVLVNLKVVVPEVQPSASESNIDWVDAATPITHLPQLPPVPTPSLAAQRSSGSSSPSSSKSCMAHQLVSPKPCKQLEADRLELFEVYVPAAVAVVVGQPGQRWMSLPPAPGRPGVFAGMVVLPRYSSLQLRALAQPARKSSSDSAGSGSSSRTPSGGSKGPGSSNLGPRADKPPPPPAVAIPPPEEWVLLMSLAVQPQVQVLLVVPDPNPLPELNPCAPWMPRLRKMAAALDSDKDGRISRRDMLKAFRRDRQLADHLRMPPRIKVGDGTFDKFLVKFIAMNRDGLGYVDEQQLAAYLGLGAAEGDAAAGWEVHSNAPSSASRLSRASRAAPSMSGGTRGSNAGRLMVSSSGGGGLGLSSPKAAAGGSKGGALPSGTRGSGAGALGAKSFKDLTIMAG